jgi:hypothetical protein
MGCCSRAREKAGVSVHEHVQELQKGQWWVLGLPDAARIHDAASRALSPAIVELPSLGAVLVLFLDDDGWSRFRVEARAEIQRLVREIGAQRQKLEGGGV